MAAPVLCGRTAALCRILTGISSSRCGVLSQTASYNPRPLRFNLDKPFIPDKDCEDTPKWQKTARYDRKLYGRYGSASGIDPASLWPSHDELDRILEEEAEWQPSLATMQKNIALKEKKALEERLAKERIIAESMAKMPKLIEDWRRKKREAKQQLKEDKARRESLRARARERLGVMVDPRSVKFKEMVAEIEKEEKKKKKDLKKRTREEQLAALRRPVAPPAASSS